MLKRDVLNFYGTLEAVGKVVGISKQGVWMWPEVIPQGHAWKLQSLTGGRLKVIPSLYKRQRRGAK
jgi:hypothetical protein